MTDPVGLYEQLKDDLGYLQLGRAAECFATLAEQASRDDWTHVEYLAKVIAEQASATTNRRLAARLRFARFPSGGPSRTSTSTSSPPSTANSWTIWPPCASSARTARSCSWASPAAARPTSP